MRIEYKGRNVPVPERFRAHLERRLLKVSRQLSDLARLEVEVREEKNRRVTERFVVEGTLFIKGAVLRARDQAADPLHAANLMVEELSRQVKRHRDKLRRRRERERAKALGEPSAWLRSQRGILLTP